MNHTDSDIRKIFRDSEITYDSAGCHWLYDENFRPIGLQQHVAKNMMKTDMENPVYVFENIVR